MRGIENLFTDVTSFSNKNLNERRNFDLNITVIILNRNLSTGTKNTFGKKSSYEES